MRFFVQRWLWSFEETRHAASLLFQWGEGAFFADALVVPRREAAYGLCFFHFNAEMLFHKINSGKNGKIGVPFAAAGTAH